MLNDTISVVQISGRDPMQFAVHVSCGGTTTKHLVTLSETHFRKLSEGRSDPAGLIEAAFRFLLKRESNLKIMDRFDLPAIGQYFPEFARELPDYLPGVDSSNVANIAAAAEEDRSPK